MYSVIIPVYQAKAGLGRCVSSWLSQTREDFELILVDDGSTDGSAALCDELAKTDARIQVVHQENAGVSAARNAGVKRAKGEFLLFTDSDDYVASDYLEKMASLQADTDSDLVLCGYHHLYDGGDIQKIPGDACLWALSDFSGDFLSLYGQGYLNMPWNKLYRRELAGTFDLSLSLGEDLLFNLAYVRKCRRIAVLPEALCYYIQEEQKVTLSSRKREDRLMLARRVCDETERFYKETWGEPGAQDAYAGIFTRYMNEVFDECEKLPAQKDMSLREKLSAIRGYAMDDWVCKRGDTAILTCPDYKIVWFFLKRRMAGMVYIVCVFRRAAVLAVHNIRRIRRKGQAIWNR